jgi:hypothetical protein
MRVWFLIVALCYPFKTFPATEDALPAEVSEYIEERKLCDHFRGEPYEGFPERRIFIIDSLDIYCAGTDRRLKALKRRYRDDERVVSALSSYELCVELNCGELSSRRFIE